MARKASKTSTQQAQQAAEPKVMGLTGWTGINIKDAALGWEADTADQFNNSSLSNKFFLVQNNLDTTSSKDVECRQDIEHIAIAPASVEFTGIACLHESMLYCAFSDESIRVHDIMSSSLDSWTQIEVTDPDGSEATSNPWTCLGFYEQTFIALRQDPEIYTGSFDGTNELGHSFATSISSAKKIPDPTQACTLGVRGTLEQKDTDYVSRISITYTYSNRFGSTLDCSDWATISVDASPAEWSAIKYLAISGSLQADLGDDWASYDITGIDLYERQDENSDAIFIGHVEPASDGRWYYNWLGAMSDTSVWSDVSLTVPSENTTKGVKASYFNVHDGRLFFWGGEEKYRLYIGGNPGNELSVATGVGGAFVDIEPGSGIEVKGTAKFKTYNGATTTTVMCGNPNSGRVKRYNIIETNLTVTSDVSTKSYSTEEVANVVGCNSYYGFGSFYDGLYAVNRYGLLVTTAVMESNNQLRVNNMSDAIAPIFTDRMAGRLANARLVYANEIIYICMADEDDAELDNLILCYDVNEKAWYTYTYDEDVPIRHMMNIDYLDHTEGLGIITKDKIDMFCLTGVQEPTIPNFTTYIETAELSSKMPIQSTSYLDQIEIHFDYFIGDVDITLEGVDYYGRHQTIQKTVSYDKVRYKLPVYIKVCLYLDSWHIKIKGRARYRLTHMLFKLYQESNKINQVYGYDDSSWYYNRNDEPQDVHHYIKSYNNLKEAIVT